MVILNKAHFCFMLEILNYFHSKGNIWFPSVRKLTDDVLHFSRCQQIPIISMSVRFLTSLDREAHLSYFFKQIKMVLENLSLTYSCLPGSVTSTQIHYNAPVLYIYFNNVTHLWFLFRGFGRQSEE